MPFKRRDVVPFGYYSDAVEDDFRLLLVVTTM